MLYAGSPCASRRNSLCFRAVLFPLPAGPSRKLLLPASIASSWVGVSSLIMECPYLIEIRRPIRMLVMLEQPADLFGGDAREGQLWYFVLVEESYTACFNTIGRRTSDNLA